MVRIAEDAGYDFNLLKGVVTVNEEQLNRVADKVIALAGGSVDGQAIGGVGPHVQGPHRRPARVAVAGRSSAASRERGAIIRAFDPAGPRARLEGIEVVDDPYAAVEGAEVLAVLTEWDEFRWLDIDKVAELMAPDEGRRRPQPARPRRARAARLRLPRHRPQLMAPRRRHRRGRVPRLAPLRARCSTGATRSSPSTTSSPAPSTTSSALFERARLHVRPARRQQLHLRSPAPSTP